MLTSIGTSIEAIKNPKIRLRPGNRYLANAYPAIAHNRTVNAVYGMVTTRLFKSERHITSPAGPVNSAEKLASVGWDGGPPGFVVSSAEDLNPPNSITRYG